MIIQNPSHSFKRPRPLANVSPPVLIVLFQMEDPLDLKNTLNDNKSSAVYPLWLKNYVTDPQLISIENFSPVRIDRLRDGGGSLLYIHSPLTYENTRTISDGSTCEDVICTIGNIKTIVASVYRPPDACASQPKNLLSFLSDYLKSSENESYKDIMLTGDFNFPNIDWETSTVLPTQGADQCLRKNVARVYG